MRNERDGTTCGSASTERILAKRSAWCVDESGRMKGIMRQGTSNLYTENKEEKEKTKVESRKGKDKEGIRLAHFIAITKNTQKQEKKKCALTYLFWPVYFLSFIFQDFDFKFWFHFFLEFSFLELARLSLLHSFPSLDLLPSFTLLK